MHQQGGRALIQRTVRWCCRYAAPPSQFSSRIHVDGERVPADYRDGGVPGRAAGHEVRPKGRDRELASCGDPTDPVGWMDPARTHKRQKPCRGGLKGCPFLSRFSPTGMQTVPPPLSAAKSEDMRPCTWKSGMTRYEMSCATCARHQQQRDAWTPVAAAAAGRQAGRQGGRQGGREAGREAGLQAGREAGRQAGRQQQQAAAAEGWRGRGRTSGPSSYVFRMLPIDVTRLWCESGTPCDGGPLSVLRCGLLVVRCHRP